MKKFFFTVLMLSIINISPAFAGISNVACYSYNYSSSIGNRNYITGSLNGSGNTLSIINKIWIIHNGRLLNNNPIWAMVSGFWKYNPSSLGVTLKQGDSIQVGTYTIGQGYQWPPAVRCK